MEKLKNTLETQEKKGNNNILEKVTSSEKRSQVFEEQTTLFGKSNIKSQFRLNNNQFNLLSIFALNPDGKFSRNLLYRLISKNMHTNTISNFLTYAESNNLITRQKIIPGGVINTLMVFKKFPDTFDDGSMVPKGSATYYKVTNLGINTFNLNEKIRT